MTTEAQRERQERVETLRNDARLRQQPQGTTLSQFAQAEANLDLGRFGTLGNPHVTGSTANPNYPAASAPFQYDPCGPEPSLGVDLNFVEPCGTPAEVAASLDQLQAQIGSHSPDQPDGGAATPPASSSLTSLDDVVEAAAPPFSNTDDDPPHAA
jgi:hypothetical protein